MNNDFTEAEADRHNALIEKGWAILNDYIYLSDRRHAGVGFFAKRRLRKAIGFFHDALSIAPENYSTKWALGKIYQVLDDPQTSLRWFEEAWAIEKQNVDVSREASLAAMECGDFEKALGFCDKAIELSSDDPGLHCNRALALMFLKRDSEAMKALDLSLKLDPADQITLGVRKLVQSVSNGNRQRPKSTEEI